MSKDREIVSNWLAGKGLLNGNRNQVFALLKQLEIEVSSEVPAADGRPEDMISIKGPADKINALKALMKGKMVY